MTKTKFSCFSLPVIWKISRVHILDSHVNEISTCRYAHALRAFSEWHLTRYRSTDTDVRSIVDRSSSKRAKNQEFERDRRRTFSSMNVDVLMKYFPRRGVVSVDESMVRCVRIHGGANNVRFITFCVRNAIKRLCSARRKNIALTRETRTIFSKFTATRYNKPNANEMDARLKF